MEPNQPLCGITGSLKDGTAKYWQRVPEKFETPLLEKDGELRPQCIPRHLSQEEVDAILRYIDENAWIVRL